MTSRLEFEHFEDYQLRSRKLEELRALGIDPYPHKYTPTHTAAALHEEFDDTSIGDSEHAARRETPRVCLSGRLVLFRAMGKNAFAHIQDHTGRIQVMFNKDNTEVAGYNRQKQDSSQPNPLKIIEKKIDIGDIIGVEGHLFHTQKGELTVYVTTMTLVCKTLLPLAEKHSGLHDKEIRYRKRWLDLVSNPEVKETFLARSRIISLTRKYCEKSGFIEVETPILQSIYGGAEAMPFLTKLNALDQKMFLRISIEIALKKLIVGGIERIFEIGRVFRNEGMDRTHNPEFTMLEAYAAYWDYNDMMAFMENLVEMLALQLHGRTTLNVAKTHGESTTIDLKAPWKRLSMKDSLHTYASLDVDTQSDQDLYRRLIDCGHLETKKVKTFSRGLMIAALFEHLVQPHLLEPHHITDFPIETTPLCKLHRDPQQRDQGIVERFESFILGEEFCNAYSELNDPLVQKQLLEEQIKRREAGDQEAHPFDHEFIEAICQGMPPTGGIGIGIDRLIMLLTDSDSIRDVLFFPWMKPLTSS